MLSVSSRFAENASAGLAPAPPTTFLWSCHRSSKPGDLLNALQRHAAALTGAVVEHDDPGLPSQTPRASARGRDPRLRDVDEPDAVPGHSIATSWFHGRSPKFANLNRPCCTTTPTDAVSSGLPSGRLGMSVQCGLAAPDRAIGRPSASTTVTSSPLTETLSPAATTMCLALANAAAQSSAYSPVFLFHRRHILQRRPVIDEGPHRQRQMRDAARVVAVEVRDEQRVDAADPGGLCHVGDTRRVAPQVLVRIWRVETREADVDHEGLAGWRRTRSVAWPPSVSMK
mgnify:CR=1 FL=1